MLFHDKKWEIFVVCLSYIYSNSFLFTNVTLRIYIAMKNKTEVHDKQLFFYLHAWQSYWIQREKHF